MFALCTHPFHNAPVKSPVIYLCCIYFSACTPINPLNLHAATVTSATVTSATVTSLTDIMVLSAAQLVAPRTIAVYSSACMGGRITLNVVQVVIRISGTIPVEVCRPNDVLVPPMPTPAEQFMVQQAKPIFIPA